ncbi:MAG TPA: class I SAM-dependent methyltransferase [Bacteroidales bacterium]|nr:class I SAM-dependent methyltransferase [Bacteroidales bacterium]
MNNIKRNRVCPIEVSWGLDNTLRKLVQNPRKILKPYIGQGMTVVDLGCGPGFFTIEIARMVGETGKVIAADLQEGMLEKVNNKIKDTELEQRIGLHRCKVDEIGIEKKVDFILAFYMVHEVPDKERLFKELKSILKPGGNLFIIEPWFHVSKRSFENMIENLNETGFELTGKPKVAGSRAVLLTYTN